MTGKAAVFVAYIICKGAIEPVLAALRQCVFRIARIAPVRALKGALHE